jgi:hypothetical protein
LARALKGEAFRDGDDLVASGHWLGFPVEVRFSHAESTPGINIRLNAPAGFTLSVMPLRAAIVAGRVLVRTPDELFNSRFAVRTDDPTQARLFLEARQVMPSLQTLCRSSQTFVLISPGLTELSEMDVLVRDSALRVREHLRALGQLARQLQNIPGARMDTAEVIKPPRTWVGHTALAVGLAAAIIALVTATARTGAIKLQQESPAIPVGVLPSEAKLIPDLGVWRLATMGDYDGGAVAWLRVNGRIAEGRIEGDFCPGGSPNDVAYVLVRPESIRRLVLICDRQLVYDASYSYLGMAVRVPAQGIPSIEWKDKPPEEPEGDGLMITLSPNDSSSGLVLFPHGRRILTGVPLDYQSVRLQ